MKPVVTIRSFSPYCGIRPLWRGLPLRLRSADAIFGRYRLGSIAMAAIPFALLRRNWSLFLHHSHFWNQQRFHWTLQLQALAVRARAGAQSTVSPMVLNKWYQTVGSDSSRKPDPLESFTHLVSVYQRAALIGHDQPTPSPAPSAPEHAVMRIPRRERELIARQEIRITPEIVERIQRGSRRHEETKLELLTRRTLVQSTAAHQQAALTEAQTFSPKFPKPPESVFEPAHLKSAAPLSIDHLADQVIRQIDRRLIASRERKGLV